ncbi:hypothetical protein Loa_01867 [Legionella oakridgensis ATCC 33761 = DSM 21215]|uniref:Uncharacterized protein n=1 Tax=Legionella oakridgensis ATCC 33761 = DSM 21215 TaxID=1268635 RepID=W0BG54_9GAMM|nr:hypothetical protein [Legionella oakridgensis]AHE67414.1 hypothetical protein Loa_01867 [Legionella oakridgensis ATCC 33761 = DSM 21215]
MKILVDRYITLSQKPGFLRSLTTGFSLLIISFLSPIALDCTLLP